MDRFNDVAMPWILQAEGGYVDDPVDPGGETNMGICKRSYPHLDIKNLTVDQVREIYRRDYWQAAGCHLMPPRLDVAVFDGAVLQGPATAVKQLQKVLGVMTDGDVGPQTLAAIQHADNDLIYRLLAHRLRKQTKMKGWKDFSASWSMRILNLYHEVG